jgi:hypothetical protein
LPRFQRGSTLPRTSYASQNVKRKHDQRHDAKEKQRPPGFVPLRLAAPDQRRDDTEPEQDADYEVPHLG